MCLLLCQEGLSTRFGYANSVPEKLCIITRAHSEIFFQFRYFSLLGLAECCSVNSTIDPFEPMKVAILASAMLCGIAGFCTHGVAQENWWQLGGEGGVPWTEVGGFGLMTDDSTSAGALQPFELKPDENLLPRLGPWQRFRFTSDPVYRLGHPRLWVGHGNFLLRSRDVNLGNYGILYQVNLLNIIDGDPITYVERRDEVADPRSRAPSGSTIYYTIDMGAQVPVERFVFYPPEGVSPDNDQPYRPNYVLKSFSLTSNKFESGILVEEMERFFSWRGEGFCCPLENLLAHRTANRDSVTELRFPLQALRFLRLLEMPDGITLEGQPIVVQSAHAEFEVYGRGFAPAVTWESQIVDLGREVNFGQVVFEVSKWRKDAEHLVAQEDGPVRVQVEMRTGRDETPTAYFGFDDLGAHVELTRKEWERLVSTVHRATSISSISTLEAQGATAIAGFRGPVVEDLENWSFWSVPLEQSGEHPRLPWGRYFQLRVQLETDVFFEFARVDSLQIEIAPLLADRVVGEVVLEQDRRPQGGRVRVPVGEKKLFVYDLGVEFSGADRTGFDVVRVMTPAEAEFGWLEMGDPMAAVEPDSIVNEENGFVVFLPRRLSPEGDQRLRIGLETVLYGEAAKFGGEVFNRGQQNLLQRVESGDVSEELGSNQMLVVASVASAGGLLGHLETGSRVFTPQGDGINDHLSIQYSLFRVQQASEVKIDIYALDGRRVWQAEPEAQAAGRHTARWDGRDGAGELVGPGIYLVRVEVETDKGSETALQPVAVVY